MYKLWKRGVSLLAMLLLFPFSSQSQVKNPWLRGQPRPVPLLIIAHRGASGYAPENTLAAFEKGIRLGAHMFELDVHFSKDGTLVVVHDDSLVRCSNVKKLFPDRSPYWVSDFTWGEIQTLDAGNWYVEEMDKSPHDRQMYLRSITDEEKKSWISADDWKLYRSGQIKHPALEEALLLAKKLGCFVNIEIKQIPRFYQDIAVAVVKLVEKLDMTHQVVISSFDHYQVAYCKKLNPHIATALLCVERIYDIGAYATQIVHADGYNPGCYGAADAMGFQSLSYQQSSQLNLEAVRSALQAQMTVNAWTENDPKHMAVLMDAGITGIFSDYPNRLVAVARQKGLVK